MFAGLTVEDLIALRLELQYALQKVERAFVALSSERARLRNPTIYATDQFKAGKHELEHADFMLRNCAKNLLPTFEALAEEAKVTS